MVQYRRSQTPGGTYFFTVNLRDRTSQYLTTYIDDLRKAFHDVRQRRYWEHEIRNDLDLQKHVDYIHFNPVKHGHVSNVIDWPHSSFHRYVRDGLLEEHWGGQVTVGGGGYGE
ncbi:MAG: transposase [Aestuariibacter sp.]|nr:transposase [Aestuariibacter sp.]